MSDWTLTIAKLMRVKKTITNCIKAGEVRGNEGGVELCEALQRIDDAILKLLHREEAANG